MSGVIPRSAGGREPLLKHAGAVCELGSRIEVAMDGITGASDRIRQFLTSESNTLDYELLVMLAEEFNAPAARERRRDRVRARLSLIPGGPELTGPDPSDTPEP